MPKFHRDEVARLEDIEALMTTAQDLIDRFKLDELSKTRACLADALHEVRDAKASLVDRWRSEDRGKTVSRGGEHRTPD